MSTTSPAENIEFFDPAKTEVVEHEYGEGCLVIERLATQEREPYPVLADLLFVNEVGEQYKINDLLPHSRTLIVKDSTPEIYYKTDDNAVYYGYGRYDGIAGKLVKFWTSGAMLALMHEFGHIKYDRTMTAGEAKLETSLINRLKNPKSEAGAIYPAELPIALNILRRERRAWVYAWETVKDLRAQGIDIEPELSTTDILARMYLALSTYEEPIMQNFALNPNDVERWWRVAGK